MPFHQGPCSHWNIHVPSERSLSCVSRQFLPLLLGLPLREFRTPRAELLYRPKTQHHFRGIHFILLTPSPQITCIGERSAACLLSSPHGSRSGDAAARPLANSELFLLDDGCRVSRRDPSPFHSTPRHASWRCLCGPCCVQHPCGRQWPPGSGFRRK